ncbi:hypothetical protein [Hyphomicrobium sp. CS1GBMeth3]|uniref:hypothetical protein n=1 Tax=Hyphomicrobium sp. CS1GBMeth3 TaxID=1892845 RepID=UPI00093152D0|nr:hypothetical protein [Hyphomicrobium sp. CS1GBMeth3]
MRALALGFMLATGAGALATGYLAVPPAAAEYTLDTSRLARTEGSKITFSSPSTTIYTAPDSVPATADAVAKLLAASGWQHYEDPFSASAQNPQLSIKTFKKDRQGLTVFVTLAPAQGNATSVSYTANAIVDDLPFLKDASEIRFAPDRPYLSLVTAVPLESSLTFFHDELVARGWAPWSRVANRKFEAGEDIAEANDRGKFAFFVRENHRPIMLMLQRRDDGRLDARIEGVSEDLLTALNKKEEPVAEAAVSEPEAEHTVTPGPDAFDTLAGEILDQVRKATEGALADLNRPAAKAGDPSPASIVALEEAHDGSTPLPLPATAEAVDFDGSRGELEFESASDVKSLAQFYRGVLQRDGWKPERSAIDKDNMVVLRFAKDKRDVSVTVMKFGNRTRVSASGSGLVTRLEDAESAVIEVATLAEPDAALQTELMVEDRAGLPIPAPHSISGSEKSLFRLSVNASVPASVETVLAFYRRELAGLGWNEQAGASVTKDRAEIAYLSPEGPAVLTLAHRNGETVSSLTLRKQNDAQKAGMLPGKGQVKLLIGNTLDKEATLTIGKRKVKIAAGSGAEKPDGPTLEVAPGKQTILLHVSGEPSQSEEVEVAAGDIWGLVIGPGGVLALQMY